MTKLQDTVSAKFLAKLEEATHWDAEKIEQLRKLLADSKKLKPDDLGEDFLVLACRRSEVIKLESVHIEEYGGFESWISICEKRSLRFPDRTDQERAASS